LSFEMSDTHSTTGVICRKALTVTVNNIGIFLNYFHKPVAVTLHRYDSYNPSHTRKVQSSFTYMTSAVTNWLVGVWNNSVLHLQQQS